jgi:hypothetical protein
MQSMSTQQLMLASIVSVLAGARPTFGVLAYDKHPGAETDFP